MPKSIRNRFDFRTCDFSFFAKSITLKLFLLHDCGCPKSKKRIKNQCKIYARKKDAEKLALQCKIDSKWLPKSKKSRKMKSKTRPENRCGKMAACPDPLGGSAVCGGAPSKTKSHLFSSRFHLFSSLLFSSILFYSLLSFRLDLVCVWFSPATFFDAVFS